MKSSIVKYLVLALLALSFCSSAVAGPRHGYGWHRGHGYYAGIYFAPWPLYVGPYYPVYSVQYVQSAPVVSTTYYVQGNESGNTTPNVNPQQSSTGDWYYCNNPDGYYPYIKTCNTAWQRVPATPR